MSESAGRPGIVVFGSIVHDLISYTERFPRPGESVRGTVFQQGPGGKGANQAVAAARLGARVQMIGKVGTDIFGQVNVDALRAAGVNATGVDVSEKAHTATATITVAHDGENSIVVVLGANSEFSPATADEHEEQIAKAGLILCQVGQLELLELGQETNGRYSEAKFPETANRRAFELARKHGVTTFFNPAPGDPNMDPSILQLVDIVCANENETEFITGLPASTVDEAKKAAAKILTMGPRTVLITLGPKGCVIGEAEKDDIVHVPLAPVKAVDTTGAGDCFCGSLAAILWAQKDTVSIVEAATRSAGIAALSVQRRGTQGSYWTKQEIIDAGHGHLIKDI